jgi:hypothetical protein
VVGLGGLGISRYRSQPGEAQSDLTFWILVGKPSVNESEVREAFANAMTLLNDKTKPLGANIIVEDYAEEFASEIKELAHAHKPE